MFAFVDTIEWKPIDPTFNKELENSALNKEDRKELETLFKETNDMLMSWKNEKLADVNYEITQGDIEKFSVHSLDMISTIYNKLNFELKWNLRIKNVEFNYFISDYLTKECIYKASDYSLMYGETIITYFYSGIQTFLKDNHDLRLFEENKKEIMCSLSWEIVRSMYELFNKWEIKGFGDMKENENAKLILYVLAPLNRKFHAINKNYMYYIEEMNKLAEMRKELINSSGPNERLTNDMLMDHTIIPTLVQQ